MAFLNPVIDLKVGDTILVTEKGEPLWNIRALPDGAMSCSARRTVSALSFARLRAAPASKSQTSKRAVTAMNAMPPNAEPMEISKANPGVHISRAGFLSLVGKSLLAICGLLGLGGLVEFLSFQPTNASHEVRSGRSQQLPPGSHTLIPEARAVLLHDSSGFTALSLICPHLGCTVEQAPDGYACPCHGSRFNLDGSLRNGPPANR